MRYIIYIVLYNLLRTNRMRVTQNPQMQLGEVDISEIEFNIKSRDDIPKVLKGLQYIYVNLDVRRKIFSILEEKVLPKVNKKNGRPGMMLWKILVLGTLRISLNLDYDRLQELANHHNTIREMLGHGEYDNLPYELQTLKDNIRLLTPELLYEINQHIVTSGHALIKKKDLEILFGRCDSFVVETNVHFPTDINLLFDAMRKVITLTARWCDDRSLTNWRQHEYNLRQIKRLMRIVQKSKHGKGKTEEQKEMNKARIISSYKEYLETAEKYLSKVQDTLALLEQNYTSQYEIVKKLEIEYFIEHARRQIDQTRRRVIHGEIIPHNEKVFSIFEPHTEWISKGKAGVPVELGVKVCILEDQHQFILHSRVMQNETDDQVAVPMVTEAKKHFPNLNACSFDKGFHSTANQLALQEHLELVALSRKGKLSQQARSIEQSKEFVKARRAHSAVESAINALEVHGLDMCPDHGINGFKRYVAFAVVARNIHRIGDILWQQEQKREQRKKKACLNQAPPLKTAA
jgi:transposase, IS5 family